MMVSKIGKTPLPECRLPNGKIMLKVWIPIVDQKQKQPPQKGTNKKHLQNLIQGDSM